MHFTCLHKLAGNAFSYAKSDACQNLRRKFSLGGGTFDVAIVQCVAGNATIVGHAGINTLGGEDFDRMLVNSVVRPWLLKSFDLPPDFQKMQDRLVRVARYRAEVAKIALSTQPTDRIFADEHQIGTKDGQGEDMYLDIEISRSDLEKLIVEDVDRTIELCRNTIAECGYKSEDLDRVVLIGGPSQMPLVRERIGTQLGIRVDFNIDPMTAVGVGAAIYAESRDWSGASSQPKTLRGSTKTSGPIDIRFDYPKRTTEQKIRIQMRCNDLGKAKGLRIQIDTDSGWTSGQLPLATTTEVTGVLVARPGENLVEVTILDELGTKKDDLGTRFSVTRTTAAADGMPLMHNIAVAFVDEETGLNKLHTIISKGTIGPKQGCETSLGAARDFSSSDKSTLDFDVYQHADDVEDPEHALLIGACRLSANSLDRGDVIRKGDRIFIDWKIDENGLLNCTFSIPDIKKTFPLCNMYVPAAGHKSFDGENGHKIAADALERARDDVENIEGAFGSGGASQVSVIRKRLARFRGDLTLANDSDAQRKVYEEARLISQEVAQIKGKPENMKATLRADLDRFVKSCSIELLPKLDGATNTKFHRLAGLARDAVNKGTPQALEDAKNRLDDMREVIFSDLMKRPDFWSDFFESVAEDRHLAIDKSRHDRLVSEGQQAIAQKDLPQLRSVVWDMQENMIKATGPSSVSNLAGLLRLRR